jgi:glycyl-tRNA synthetase (class II)
MHGFDVLRGFGLHRGSSQLLNLMRLTPRKRKTKQVTAPMVEIKRQQKRLAGRNFIPSVIEPSFGIGRILYCVFEHSYYTREVGGRAASRTLCVRWLLQRRAQF